MYSTMAALQALAAEVTATIIVPEQIQQLRAMNLDFENAMKSGQAYQAMELDEQFHNFIVELSDNPYVAHIVLRFRCISGGLSTCS